MPPKQPTQRDIQAETRRTGLIDLALALFAERGVENVSIKDIAAGAGIAQGLIYHYFHSKDELLVAVFQRHNPLHQFEAMIAELGDMPARDGLRQFARKLAVLLPEKRPVLRLLIREMLSPRSPMLNEVVALREHVITLLTGYLQHRIDAGELREHPSLVAIHMLVSSLLTLTLLEQPIEPLVGQFIDILLDGIRAR